MGAAKTLPLLDNCVDDITCFARRDAWSVGASCGAGTDIANMADVSDEIISILTNGRYDPTHIQALMEIQMHHSIDLLL